MLPNDEREQDRLGQYQLMLGSIFGTDEPLLRPPASLI